MGNLLPRISLDVLGRLRTFAAVRNETLSKAGHRWMPSTALFVSSTPRPNLTLFLMNDTDKRIDFPQYPASTTGKSWVECIHILNANELKELSLTAEIRVERF